MAQGPQTLRRGCSGRAGRKQNTCYDLDDPPSTCRSPQLSRPIHAQPPTLSTVTTIRRSSEPKEPPRHRISTPPCHPAGEFNR
ncbi:hypothetical protein F2Q69_00061800 [Brassica cretica]|uniref:Uncharacterized protein n=1 Tax=Brassica cretica TaxID=69181 RepID=A0A8S9RM66_BRACR|nr:hypothetical protein F2Q69_00061800 [Brassica cretica]